MKELLGALLAALVPVTADAHGALAIGLPPSIEKDGFATGISWGYASVSEPRLSPANASRLRWRKR